MRELWFPPHLGLGSRDGRAAGVWCFLGSFFFFFDRVSWVVGRRCGGVERGRREKPLPADGAVTGWAEQKEKGEVTYLPLI